MVATGAGERAGTSGNAGRRPRGEGATKEAGGTENAAVVFFSAMAAPTTSTPSDNSKNRMFKTGSMDCCHLKKDVAIPRTHWSAIYR